MILILNCDFDENPETNGAQLIASHLRKKSIRTEIKNVFENEFPDKLEKFDRIIITGSRAAVYVGYEWIAELSGLIKKIDKLNIQTLGICFGYQMVAETFGGSVIKSKSREEGFAEIKLTDEGKNNLLFNSFPDKFAAYQSHEDVVKKFPAGSVTLAENNSVQAYQFRKFYCVQFHPEILPETAVKMATRDNKNIEKILNAVPTTYIKTADVLFNFANL